MKVRAKTYPDDDREIPPKEVEGELKTIPVETLEYIQHWVDGVLADPETVEPIVPTSTKSK